MAIAPIYLALLGAGFNKLSLAPSVTVRSGARGLASVIFALLALEDLGAAWGKEIVAVVWLTVLVSVVAHGFSAVPLANRFTGAATKAGVDNGNPA